MKMYTESSFIFIFSRNKDIAVAWEKATETCVLAHLCKGCGVNRFLSQTKQVFSEKSVLVTGFIRQL